MTEESWYYCLKHHAVEPYEACKAIDRLGPYASVAEAEQALERVAQRNEQWDEEDRREDVP
ncbi:hypothetical protein [Propionicimonas sp.]|uniref:hypothetical protein n=1 Tax=Propionicimonas sp. TaxID=1955623 RepID=UPI00184980F0|nr:hypothetical protein [Propionicimonas sp.]MBU3977935.1 hypothetical protein [Actinomycetota bacterium]MBA3021842.1 hypothetical protein [Propionicimonas sp.]MBU3985379.1 hypothetical protein [Actinomycetota bacterium]MBU4007474.1 hypothetical protein [Actinomycetota bacterium]MBU4066632.1 hypothetical protein [Actinomycetota bacterium]